MIALPANYWWCATSTLGNDIDLHRGCSCHVLLCFLKCM